MKLRIDLLEKLTPEMVMEGVVMNTHRYKPEPLLSKTGVGSLASATAKDRAREDALSMAIIQKLTSESASDGKKPASVS
jgi:hypothetical protein